MEPFIKWDAFLPKPRIVLIMYYHEFEIYVVSPFERNYKQNHNKIPCLGEGKHFRRWKSRNLSALKSKCFICMYVNDMIKMVNLAEVSYQIFYTIETYGTFKIIAFLMD